MIRTISIMAMATALVGCGQSTATTSADGQRRAQTEQLMREAARQIPAPAISNFQQLRWQTYLYELQDNAIATYSYTTTMEGELIFLCPSVGYGMNASIQITNPERIWIEGQDVGSSTASYRDVGGTIPQPEPNGLFMPEGLASTYVMCADRTGDGEPDPLYVESDVLVSLTALPHDKSWWVEAAASD